MFSMRLLIREDSTESADGEREPRLSAMQIEGSSPPIANTMIGGLGGNNAPKVCDVLAFYLASSLRTPFGSLSHLSAIRCPLSAAAMDQNRATLSGSRPASRRVDS